MVVARSTATHSVELFDLQRADGAPLPGWQPGAHIDLVLPSTLERQYSIVESPNASTWRIAVLREPGGRGGSEWLHASLDVGSGIRVRGPRNHFVFVPTASTPYLFLAAGIGVTPIVSMVRAAEAAGVEHSVHYSARSREGMALLEHLPGATLHLSDEGSRLDLATLVTSLDPATQIFCCGPARFIEAVEMVAGNHPLHVERFEARARAAPVVEHQFEVELLLSGQTLVIPSDRSILEVVEEAGVFVLSSCREGTCGTCETPVVSGAVEHRDSILTPIEQQQNAVMYICVSRAACPHLVLEL